jgi:Smad anchor for receptor activation-like, C-terminal
MSEEPLDEATAWEPWEYEVIPEALSAMVYVHEIKTSGEPVPVWTYASYGLEDVGQPEVILTLRRRADEAIEDVPPEPLNFFKGIYKLASQGKLVAPGGYTHFRGDGFLSFHGVLYGQASALGMELAPGTLAAILVSEDELQAAKLFGNTRILGRLAKQVRHYPQPLWSDRDRPRLEVAEIMESSLLARIARLGVPGIRATADGKRLTLRIDPAAADRLLAELDELPSDLPFALLLEVDPEAQGCLIWEGPSQQQPTAVAPAGSPGKALCACFLLVAPGQDTDLWRTMEDGYGLVLTEASTAALRETLTRRGSWELSCKDDKLFRLLWTAPPDPAAAVPAPGAATTAPLVSTRLLTPEAELEARIGTEPLALFIKVVSAGVDMHLASCEPGASTQLRLTLELTPDGKLSHKASAKPPLPPAALHGIPAVVEAAPRPEITGGPVACELVYAVWGGDAEGEGSAEDA